MKTQAPKEINFPLEHESDEWMGGSVRVPGPFHCPTPSSLMAGDGNVSYKGAYNKHVRFYSLYILSTI